MSGNIKYRIIPTKLQANPDGFVARVQPYRSVDVDEIAEEIAQLGTTVSKADILNVLSHYYSTIEKMLLNGLSVNTPAGIYRVTIKGTFTDEGDPFDPARHQVVVRIAAGKGLREAVSKAHVERYMGDLATPRPATYIDTATGERNSVVTPQKEGRVIGKHLQFDPGDPRQGIFFIDAAGVETRVESVGWNKARRLIFIVPPLSAGSYRLQVRASFQEEIRSGVLQAVLEVAG